MSAWLPFAVTMGAEEWGRCQSQSYLHAGLGFNTVQGQKQDFEPLEDGVLALRFPHKAKTVEGQPPLKNHRPISSREKWKESLFFLN